jgi:putative transposase
VRSESNAPYMIQVYNDSMPNYHRSNIAGGSFFFTVVTFDRQPILTGDIARRLLHKAWMDTNEHFLFITQAVCLLPDHLHCIWTLPEADADFSVRWKEIKRSFSHQYLNQIGPGGTRNESRQRRHEAAIWQRRFWEHALRDEEDLNHHLDYLHFNPVKHGLVTKAADWPWSSFHRFVKLGYYDAEWGQGEGEGILSNPAME